MQKSYINRYNSFKKSLASLAEAKGKDKENSFILSGTAMKYNLTFDIAWKLMADILRDDFKISDFAFGSPKEALKKAKSIGIIDDDIWLDMLDDRNDITHDYDYKLIESVFDKIIEEYIPIFQSFENKVTKIINEI